MERKDKLRNQNSNPQQAPGSTTNVCVRNKTANTQSATVFRRTVEPSPNLPLVSAPKNEPIKEKGPEKDVGLVRKDDTLYVLVKWKEDFCFILSEVFHFCHFFKCCVKDNGCCSRSNVSEKI
ncbi:hypothetical protein AVEN_69139-1 [Araneus ventricosus]|uniref:Uncharacterized protein n=1 Tax=Araneus ventricosus TaxID=182803 RepID=A0A4Y2HU02_ARAVE|nr:hypothetical protein AVEN_69139-1 [Araneus ventricosus]